VKSEFLIEFYGAMIEDPQKLSIIMEFCPNGNLHDSLSSSTEVINWERVMKWCIQIVSAIDALHSCNPPIVHRDIKSLNVLLNANDNIKVCDFGLSRMRTLSNMHSLAELRGTMAYCPPEIYKGYIFSALSDIYSIGMLFWEIVSRLLVGEHQRPFAEYKEIDFDFQIIIQASKFKLRPTIPLQCPEDFRQLIEDCWCQAPEKRPSCKEVLAKLNSFRVEDLISSQKTETN